MSMLKLTIQSLFTPRLYKIYSSGPNENHYEARKLEKWGDNIIVSAITFWNISFYASPLICMYFYKKDLFTLEGAPVLAKAFGMIGMVVFVSYLMRSVGRASNPKYQQFVRALQAPEVQRLDILRQYDFEFSAFPITYTAPVKTVELVEDVSKKKSFPWYKKKPIEILAAAAVRMFGLRLIYPGTIGIIHSLVWPELLRGRASLVEENHGKRHKIRTTDGNDIDCMFVDNRANMTRKNGRTLVVCCEGNSGFYEVGVMSTPLAGGYSVLGWNHPGFAGSTGLPYPESEQQAIDAVMQFAMHKLGFPVERIVLFGWSIGGYTAAWAAKTYPNIHCLVLDATFDDLVPLAVAKMPPSWEPLVRAVVGHHVNLNVGELTQDYPGELRLVRRVHDEIICLRDGDISTNCGNALLLRVMRHRHAELMTPETESSLRELLALHGPAAQDMRRTLVKDNSTVATAVALVDKYLKDYKSTHCTPLPIDHFNIPNEK